jgi:tetratricopeptide (TPR) repeat protein
MMPLLERPAAAGFEINLNGRTNGMVGCRIFGFTKFRGSARVVNIGSFYAQAKKSNRRPMAGTAPGGEAKAGSGGSTGGRAALGPNRNRFILAGIAMAMFVAATLGFNEFSRRHRTLYVVNGFAVPVAVSLDGATPFSAGPGLTTSSVSEGHHRASLSGATRQEFDFDISPDSAGRWLSLPAWVINAGGAAVLVEERATYGKAPKQPQVAFYFGEPFLALGQVTHPFKPLPQSVKLKDGEERTLTGLSIYQEDPAALFYYLEKLKQPEEATRLAEWRLGLDPDDDNMLDVYARSAANGADADRIEKFLAAGLSNAPVHIAWHRAYQTLRRDPKRDAELAEWYDARLKSEPGNSALLYLRGLLSANHAEAARYFERSRLADPGNGYPCHALALDRMSAGDWAGARTLLATAVKLRPRDVAISAALVATRMALGEFASLEPELRAASLRDPASFLATDQLIGVLVAEGKVDEASRAIATFETAVGQQGVASAGEMAGSLRREALYMTGKFEEMEKTAAKSRDPAALNDLFDALVEQGRLEEAVKVHPLKEAGMADPYHFLAVSVAWRLKGDSATAGKWLERALALFDAGDADWRRAAALLRQTTAPSDAELSEVAQAPVPKSILLAALAQLHPDRRAELAAAARRLNTALTYPRHLIDVATK